MRERLRGADNLGTPPIRFSSSRDAARDVSRANVDRTQKYRDYLYLRKRRYRKKGKKINEGRGITDDAR